MSYAYGSSFSQHEASNYEVELDPETLFSSDMILDLLKGHHIDLRRRSSME